MRSVCFQWVRLYSTGAFQTGEVDLSTHDAKASPTVATVIVTFNPDEGALARLLHALAPQVDFGVIVDNGSKNAKVVAGLADRFGLEIQNHQTNLGIAAAQNRGITRVLDRGADFVLLSDQDSVPDEGMVANLLRTYQAETTPNPFFPGAQIALPGFQSETVAPVAAVGPVPADGRGVAGEGLVYSFTTWGAKRRYIPGEGETMEVPFVLASGCLIPREALLDVGPMNEGLFIDHVDLAWCMRAGAMGYRILVSGSAHLTHALGEEKVTLPWGRQVHAQSPFRNYFMVRNTLLLQRAPFMPLAWKLGYLSYLTKYLGFYALAGLKEPARLRQLGAGVRDGLLGRTGPRPL